MGGTVMFSCRTDFTLDVKSLKKDGLKSKAESETVVPKTMEHSAYVPRVENISPALPTDDVKDDAALQVSKDDLLHQITNIDKQITQTEAEIKNLGKKLLELQKAADLSKEGNEEEEVKNPQSPSLAIKIYAENKRKLHESNMLWEKLGPKIVMPLYNQPSDTIVYHENRKKHLVFKYCLLKFLKCKQAESSLQENYLIALYMEKKQEWLNKVKAIESSLAHKKKEAEKKIIFEREFPKLRKQIEEKRKQRLSQIESHFGAGDKGHSACAIICPMLLPSRQQEFRYINNNGLIEDLPTEYKEWQLINMWTDAEKAIFKEKFLQHPKQFGIIASYLDQKNISECIKYYYQSKRTENYKSLLRKTRKRAHMSCNGLSAKRVSVAQLNSSKVLGAQAGSVTCLQAEKEARQELCSSASLRNGDVEHSIQSSLVAQVMQPSLVDSMARSLAPSPVMSSPALTSDPVTVKKETPAATLAEFPAAEPGNVESSPNQDEKIECTDSTCENTESQSNKMALGVPDCQMKSHEEESREETEIVKTDEEYKSFGTETDNHNGIVRSIMLDHSKHLPHPDLSKYSACEQQALHGAQVSNSCNCKFRGGCYTHCQVLMYQNSPNQIQPCSTKWNDSHQKQGVADGEGELVQSHISSKCSDVSTVSESYNAAAPRNLQPVTSLPVAISSESNVPEIALQTRIHNIEKPVYGSQNISAVTKSSEECYRSLVIKTTSRFDEGSNYIDGRLHQPLKFGNGIVKPVTSSVAEAIPVSEGTVTKQVHSVKDLVMEVIEKQIMKNFGRCDDSNNITGEGKGALAPTLSSILQTHHLEGRSQSSFVPGFQSGDENRNLNLPPEPSVPTSHQPTLPLSQKQHVPPMTTYQVLATSSRSSHDYLPEGSHNFQGGVEIGKHRFPADTVIASHHRSPLLPTPPVHQKHYRLSSMHQVAMHSTPHSSPVYLPRGTVPVNQVRHLQTSVQDSEGTLDLSTKKFRAYHPPGLFSEEFPQRRPYQSQVIQQPSQLSHYLNQSAMPTVQHKVHPQELLPPVSVSMHRNRYPSVISQSVIVREPVQNFSEQSALSDDRRITNSSSGSTSNLSVHASTPQVEAMTNIYKPYFP
ncbi:hypothetical protein PR048_024660 [Dryococelus australis]|uniref:SANT domain-containing protein n=1 Tax=Dryococelus australis TaxID=614101 RepID=A0ABQ9GP95_9NEOP|nr:hypothetical protein PR048_024660 [Dryococelus australis]